MEEHPLERRVGENQDVVVEADEVDGRAVALPAVETVVRGERYREDNEGDEHDDRGTGEDRDLEALTPLALTLGPRASRGRHTLCATPSHRVTLRRSPPS